MAPRNALANISFTVDSASEDDMTHDELNALPTPDSTNENKAPARKARGTAAPTKAAASSSAKATAKGRPATRRVSGSSISGVNKPKAAVTKKAPAKPAKPTRKAQKGRTSSANASDTEEVDEFDREQTTAQVQPAKRGRPPKKAPDEEMVEAPAPAKKGRKAKAHGELAAEEVQPKKPRSKKVALAHDDKPEPVTIPETQPECDADAMDVEESIEIDEIPESMPPPPPPRPSARRAQTGSGRVRQSSHGVRRTGSVSDSERDPVMRRKVGDLTKRLEAMAAKYETLKQTASSEKESKFDQLKKRTEQTTKGNEWLGWSHMVYH